MHDVCTEAEVQSMATAMLNNGLYDVGFRYINMDDCWANDGVSSPPLLPPLIITPARAPNGSIYADPNRFPSGRFSLLYVC
jgi:alpha-galactosidase